MSLMFLKQSTAATIVLGPFVDSTDGVTAESGLTIAQADVRVSKNTGGFAQKNDTGSATHMENGYYSCALNTTDTNTLGRLRVAVAKSGALPVWVDALVMPAAVYDSLIGGSDTLPVDVTQWSGTNVAAPATAGYPVVTHKVGTGTGELNVAGGKVELVDNAINQNSVAMNAIDAAALDTSAITEIQSGLATAAALAVVDGIVDSVLNLLEARLTAARAGYLDHLATAPPSAVTIADAVWDEALVDHATAGSAGETLSDAVAGGGGPSAAAIADAIWDEALSGHAIGGSAGLALDSASKGGQLGGSVTAAENLRDGALALRRGTSVAGTLSTTQMTTNVTGLPADAVVGRLVTFLPAGALQYQQRRIIDYVAANGLITLDTALTQAVPAGATFIIQ